VFSRHSSVVAQLIAVMVTPLPAPRRLHVSPPSVVRSNVFGPTANAVLASTRLTRWMLPSSMSFSSVQEVPASVVR
jgi:hypothetical protein